MRYNKLCLDVLACLGMNDAERSGKYTQAVMKLVTVFFEGVIWQPSFFDQHCRHHASDSTGFGGYPAFTSCHETTEDQIRDEQEYYNQGLQKLHGAQFVLRG